MKPKVIVLVITMILLSFGVAIAQGSDACWGQATAVFSQMGEMGEHASQQPTGRNRRNWLIFQRTNREVDLM